MELEQKQKLEQQKIEALMHAEFIKNQMTKPLPLSQEAQLVRKHTLGGMMNSEELRMNRGLLNEIATKKKIDRNSHRGSIETLTQA